MNEQTFSRDHLVPPSPTSWWAEATQNRIIALVLAMILVVPLFATPADSSFGGIAAITLQGFALVLGTMLLWRARWDLRADTLKRFFTTSANLPILLFVALMSLSTVFSPHKGLSIQELLRTGSGVLLYFVVAYHFRQSKHLSLLAGTLLALAAVVSLGGMAKYQLFSEERASAIFGNAQPLASFVMLLLPTVAALALTDKNQVRRMTALIVGVVMLGCLMLTQGRSAMLGTAVGLLVLAWLATRPTPGQVKQKRVQEPFHARKHQLVWPVVLAVIIVGFLGSVKMQNQSLGNRITKNLATDTSWQSRVESYWVGAGKMIQERPLTGWGAGLYPVYQHAYTGRGLEIKPEGQGVRVSLAEQAHNFYLQTAAELGLPGLLLMLAVIGTFLVSGFKRVGELEPGMRRTLLMGSIAACFAFLVDAAGSPSWQYGQTAMFLWLTLGMGTSCLRPRARREEKAEKVHATSRRVALFSRPMAVAVALVVATLLPTGIGSAQSVGYNGEGDSPQDVGQIVFGTTSVLGLLYVLSSVTEAFALAGSGGGALIPVVGPTPTPTPTPLPGLVPVDPVPLPDTPTQP